MGEGKKGARGVKLRRDLMFARRHCVVSRKDAWQREGDGEKTRQDNCQGSATIFITRMGEGGRERKNHNGQLGYKLHQPLCGSLNDVSSKEGRGTGPC